MPAGVGVRVLLVEDHDIVRKVEAMILKQLSLSVDAVNSGSQALAFLARNTYDVILMDIGLPDIDGLTLTETIRLTDNRNQKTPIIALTAHADDEYKSRAAAVGMNGFLVKPMTIENSQLRLKAFIDAVV